MGEERLGPLLVIVGALLLGTNTNFPLKQCRTRNRKTKSVGRRLYECLMMIPGRIPDPSLVMWGSSDPNLGLV